MTHEYVPPYCTPEECDHQETNSQEGVVCSLCCPCAECSDIRARGPVGCAATPARYTYRFTIRPADPYTCPPGWTAIYPLVPSRQWDYGEVVYPERLPMDRADHFSLLPVRDGKAGPELWPTLIFEGHELAWREVFGREEAQRILYDYACGTVDRAAVEAYAAERAAGCEATIEVVWPDQAKAQR